MRIARVTAVAAMFLSVAARGEIYQFAVTVPPAAGRQESPRAFLWIPPACQTLRAVVFAQHNMEEERILAHPAFRKACADLGFAIIWVAPNFDANFRFDHEAGEKFDTMLAQLAEASGYPELARIPVVPMGHSAAASLPWYFAAWKPQRTLACLSISGQWPYVPDEKNAPQVAGIEIKGVPGLVTMGEYEWAEDRAKTGAKTRADHPVMPLSFLACPADGHFSALDDKVDFLCAYLRKAAQYRLKADGTLADIDPQTMGFLVDRWIINKPARFPAAPVAAYAGDRSEALWCFDEEHARLTEAFQAQQRGRATLVGYTQNGQIVPQKNGTHQQVSLSFLPDADGVTFHLGTAFLETVPEGRPEKWTGRKANDTVDHPAHPNPSDITISRITGPVREVGPGRFIVEMNRSSFLGDRRDNEAWFVAVWPGDGTFKRAVQQSRMGIPRSFTTGRPQAITFSPPDKISTDTTLSATSTSGLPVRFYVSSGPAEITGDNQLHITEIPSRSAGKPIAITVVAWQFGVKDQVQSAAPVERIMVLDPAK